MTPFMTNLCRTPCFDARHTISRRIYDPWNKYAPTLVRHYLDNS